MELQLQKQSFQLIFRVYFLQYSLFDLLASMGHSRIFSSTTIQKHQFFDTQPFIMNQLSYLYRTSGKTIYLTIWTFVGKVISLLFNMLSSLSDFPGGSDGKSVCLQRGRPGFDPWARKIPWRRQRQPTPVLLPEKKKKIPWTEEPGRL